MKLQKNIRLTKCISSNTANLSLYLLNKSTAVFYLITFSILAVALNAQASGTKCSAFIQGGVDAEALHFISDSIKELDQQNSGSRMSRLMGQMSEGQELLSPWNKKSLGEFLKTKTQPARSKNFDNMTVKSLVKEGSSLNEAFTNLNIQNNFWELYDAKGNILYKRPAELPPLKAENGTEPVKTFRIHLALDSDRSFETAKTLFKDYVRVLTVDNEAKLWAVHQQLFDDNPILAEIENLPEEIKSRILDIEYVADPLKPKGADLSFWAQDASKPFSETHTTLLQRDGTSVVGRTGYAATTKAVALNKNTSLKVNESILRFEGGNIIVGSQHIFIGPDIAKAAMQDFGVSQQDALKLISEEFGRETIVAGYPDSLGELVQTDYHIDLSFALAYSPKLKKEIAVVQSPKLLLEDALGFADLDTLSDDDFKNEKIKFLKKWSSKIESGKIQKMTENEKTFINELAEIDLEFIKEREMKLSALKIILENQGYETRRIVGRTDLRGPFQARSLETFNYVNSIFSKNKVMMGHYDIKILDDHAAKVYRDLGFEVIPMRAHPKLLIDLGGIRCAHEGYGC